jgi:hypothetical protein
LVCQALNHTNRRVDLRYPELVESKQSEKGQCEIQLLNGLLVDTNIVDLIGQVLLGLEQEDCTLLELNSDCLGCGHIHNLRLGNFFPKELCVLEKQLDVVLLESYSLDLLVELLGNLEAVDDESLSILICELGILRLLHVQGCSENQDRADGVFQLQVDLSW